MNQIEDKSKKYCPECNKTHELIAFCEKCNSCLYENSKSLNDDVFPLVKCTKCNKINFWD